MFYYLIHYFINVIVSAVAAVSRKIFLLCFNVVEFYLPILHVPRLETFSHVVIKTPVHFYTGAIVRNETLKR
jgi:hypothetical protein